VAERKNVLMVPNAALRFKPAIAAAQKPATEKGSDFQKNGGPGKTPGSTRSKKSDAFSGKLYVLEKGVLSQISVNLGITDNRNTEIVGGGLKAGDQIVVGEAQETGNSQSSSSSPMRMRLF